MVFRVRLSRSLLMIALCLMMAACQTNLLWDALFDTHDEEVRSSTNDERLALCLALENEGYQFDVFQLSEPAINEPDPEPSSVSVTLLTDISRDYDSPISISEAETIRLENEAQAFCQQYAADAERLGIDLELGGVLFWDYIAGVRGSMSFRENCEALLTSGWSTGGYGNHYEEDPNATCPAGRVVQSPPG